MNNNLKEKLDAGYSHLEQIGANRVIVIKRRFNRYVLGGSKTGDHSISVDSSEARLQAHWAGYKKAAIEKDQAAA